MQVHGGINPYESFRYGFGYIDTIQRQRAVKTTRHQGPATVDRDQSIFIRQQVMRMREAVQAIKPEMLESQQIQIASPAIATSASSLNLDLTATATTMQSTEEVNTTPTSYSTHGPEWTGASTVQATIGGIYNGSNGTDTLTFKVTRGGTRGSDRLKIKVYDSNNAEIDQIVIRPWHPVDKQYTLNNGLELTFSAGDLVKKDTFTLEVYDSIGAAVDPDKSFNGTRNDNPNLEDGLSVTAGSFQINGTTIDVQADDTLNSVLDRITQSDAGVTATFDAATETVLLTQNTPGSTPDIVLENDTSGFLAAVKLESATVSPGEDPETDKSLADVDRFSMVQSGSISVNGVSIDIDVNIDSLNDVLDRISASGAGVDASFDETAQRVSLRAESTAVQMELSSGGTQFFAAVGISEGTYNAADDLIQAGSVKVVAVADRIVDAIVEENAEKPWEQQPVVNATPVSAATGSMLTTLVGNIAGAMNTLFDDSAIKGSPGAFLEGVRNNIRSAVSSWSGSEGSRFSTDFGINFDFEKTKEGVFQFSRSEQQQFESALANPEGAASVRNALFGQEFNGLFSQLHASLAASAADLESEGGPTGLYLDISI